LRSFRSVENGGVLAERWSGPFRQTSSPAYKARTRELRVAAVTIDSVVVTIDGRERHSPVEFDPSASPAKSKYPSIRANCDEDRRETGLENGSRSFRLEIVG
jgi:hypothetical protein